MNFTSKCQIRKMDGVTDKLFSEFGIRWSNDLYGYSSPIELYKQVQTLFFYIHDSKLLMVTNGTKQQVLESDHLAFSAKQDFIMPEDSNLLVPTPEFNAEFASGTMLTFVHIVGDSKLSFLILWKGNKQTRIVGFKKDILGERFLIEPNINRILGAGHFGINPRYRPKGLKLWSDAMKTLTIKL